MRELIRRAVLRALGGHPQAPVRLDDERLSATLTELSRERSPAPSSAADSVGLTTFCGRPVRGPT